MVTCVNGLWQRSRSTLFAATTAEPETGRIAQSSAHCAGSSSRQGATQTWSAMSLSSTTGCKRSTNRHPRCGAPSWTWSPGSQVSCSSSRQTSACDARMQNVTTKVRRNQGWLQLLGKRRKRSSTEWPCERWSSRPLGDWAARAKLLRDLVTTAAANGQCSPHAVGRWRTQLE